MFLRINEFLKSPKLLKNLFRNCSANVEIKPDEGNKENHLYKKQMTKSELVKYLAENVVYNKDGIIVTNKPYGVSKEKVVQMIENYIPQTFCEIPLNEVLPDLATTLELDSLRLVKAPERLASGVTILAATDAAHEIATKGILLNKRRKGITDTYLSICLGIPVDQKLNTKFAIKSIEQKNKIAPTVVEQWTINQVKRQEVRVVKWIHNVLSFSDFASLLKIQLSFTHRNCLRLYLSTKCLSPVLGDVLYGCRVHNVFGVPLLKDSSVTVTGEPPKLKPELLSALQISQDEANIIPNMVHLFSVEFCLTKKYDIIVSVPPPEHFYWTCQQLGLATDENWFNQSSVQEKKPEH